MSTAVIIVAAGRGTRLGGPVPKQYQRLGADMVLTRTLRAALAAPKLDAVLVAIHPDAAELYAHAVAPLASIVSTGFGRLFQISSKSLRALIACPDGGGRT